MACHRSGLETGAGEKRVRGGRLGGAGCLMTRTKKGKTKRVG